MSSSIQTVVINAQPIELCKLLKIANLVSGGGEAKVVISQGLVKLNGQYEFKKRKKIVDGDTIELNDEKINVVYKAQIKEPKSLTKTSDAKQHQSDKTVRKQRKPISF